MKKIVFIFLLDFILVGGFTLTILILPFLTKNDREQQVLFTDDIYEEILPIRDNNNNFLGVDCTITIPHGYSARKLKLTPNIFGGLSEYKELVGGDNLTINITIKNKSDYIYEYKDKSFVLSTANIVDTSNYQDTLGVGFDGRKIYDLFAPYRTFNTALRDLVNGGEIGDLSNDNIEELLKRKGYKGIVELDKYYLDYYNEKYTYQAEKLEILPYSIIKEIFDGRVSDYKESNRGIIEAGYYYFYNKVLTLSFLGETVNDSNSENFSIGKFMSDSNDDKLKDNLLFDDVNIKIEGMKLSVNKTYLTESFKDYDYFGYMEFCLERVGRKST